MLLECEKPVQLEAVVVVEEVREDPVFQQAVLEDSAVVVETWKRETSVFLLVQEVLVNLEDLVVLVCLMVQEVPKALTVLANLVVRKAYLQSTSIT